MRRIRKKIKLFFAKTSRSFTRGTFGKSGEKSKQERTLLKIVRTLLNTPDSKVYCLPYSSVIYLHPKDKKYIISFDHDWIKISNHKFFFTASIKYGIGEEMIAAAKNRLESDLSILKSEISYNEENFLDDIYVNFKKAKERSSNPNQSETDLKREINKIVPGMA